jgi:hypothetical protein
MKKSVQQKVLSLRSAAHIGLTSILVALLLSSFGIADPFTRSLDRWKVPLTESESAWLGELKCLENFLKEIPDGSQVRVVSNAGPYWDQRFYGYAYPRISVVNVNVGTTVFLESELTPNTTQQCGSVFLGIDEIG